MKINPFELKQQIANLLLVFPELEADEDARLMTMESETELPEVMEMVLGNILEAKSRQVGLESRIKENKEKLDKLWSREQAWKKLAFDLMNAASLRKLQLTEATLSIRHGQASVTIIDEKVLPEECWRIKKEPDLSLIKAKLKAGTEVAGAVLNNAPDHIAILTK